jgi:hypothetical protein
MDSTPIASPAVPAATPSRRWTLLLVPHDSGAQRSFPLHERTVRRAAVGAAVVLACALVGATTVVLQLAKAGRTAVALARAVPTPVSSPDVTQLRSQLSELEATLQTIRRQNEELRTVVTVVPSGAPAADVPGLLAPAGTASAHPLVAKARASTDSLLLHATTVALRFDSLAAVARTDSSLLPRAPGARRAVHAARGSGDR